MSGRLGCWAAVALLAACGDKDTPTGETGGGDADASADADADTDSDADADTDADADGTAALRFVNASVEFGVAYVYLDGDADPTTAVPPLVASPYAPMAAGEIAFVVVATGQTPDQGAPLAVTAADQSYTTMWVAGTAEAPVLGYDADDDTAIPVGYSRYRIRNTASDVDYLRLTLPDDAPTVAYGEAVTVDATSAGFPIVVDLGVDGIDDWSFTVPSLPAGNVIPLFVTWGQDGLVLLGASPQGGSTVLDGVPVGATTTPTP